MSLTTRIDEKHTVRGRWKMRLGLKDIFNAFLGCNKTLSAKFDQLLPSCYLEGGNDYFRSDVVPNLLRPDIRVYDLGGGSRPFISEKEKNDLRLVVIGVDIDADELSRAPVGSYDKSIVADLTTFVGQGDGDLVICQSTLEHVTDTSAAMRAISSTLKPGGLAGVFAPNRNALFARINLLLPENFKRKILFTLFPEKALGHDGFKAYYANCTPKKLKSIADKCGLDLIQEHIFWKSSYFSIFFPAYLLWRVWTIVGRSLVGVCCWDSKPGRANGSPKQRNCLFAVSRSWHRRSPEKILRQFG